jgi:uncharacterized BrkB/YihY/UPF0761 family membrane protein
VSGTLKRLVARVDDWQRHSRAAGPLYALVRKVNEDQANLYVVSLGWYGFTAIFPLLLVVVTVFGYVGVGSLGKGIVDTLHEFPVIGSQFQPAKSSSSLHASFVGLVVGLVGLVYGAQGVTQVAQRAMSQIWGVAPVEQPGWLARLGRSLGGLAVIAIAFLSGAFTGSLALSHGHGVGFRIVLLAALVVWNTALYLAAFFFLSASDSVTVRSLIPGAVVGGVGFTVLTTVGAGLVEHQLRHSSATYGAIGSVIGTVTYLLLLAKLSVYAAELNSVLARRLWPRAFPNMPPTPADEQMMRQLAHTEKWRKDETIDASLPSLDGQDKEPVKTTR